MVSRPLGQHSQVPVPGALLCACAARGLPHCSTCTDAFKQCDLVSPGLPRASTPCDAQHPGCWLPLPCRPAARAACCALRLPLWV